MHVGHFPHAPPPGPYGHAYHHPPRPLWPPVHAPPPHGFPPGGYDYYRRPHHAPPHHGPPPPHALGHPPPLHAPPPSHGPPVPHDYRAPPHPAPFAGGGAPRTEVSRRSRDFAEEKPEIYKAFERMAVQSTERGVMICLPDQMCLDRHVADFLLCLECWLVRCLGEPQVTGRPWRLKTLDLSRNDLSDGSISSVMAMLKRLDVRIESLLLSGNKLLASGLETVTEYIWSNQEPLHELDLNDNDVVADPGSEASASGDVVSALLRCLYNHSSYPRTLDGGGAGSKVVPLLLKMSGNFVSHPKRLLREIQAKGGKLKVNICKDGEPYPMTAQEFLSIFAQDFGKQRKLEEAIPGTVGSAAPRHTPEERKSPSPAPVRVVPPAAAAPVAPARSRSRKRRRQKEKALALEAGSAPVEQPLKQAPVAAAPKEQVDAPPRPLEAPENKEEDASWPLGTLPKDEAEQQTLQKEVHTRLGSIDPNGEEATQDMLSEFTVCMVVAKKHRDEIEKELQTFLGPQARDLTDWLAKVLKWRYGPKKDRRTSADDAFQ